MAIATRVAAFVVVLAAAIAAVHMFPSTANAHVGADGPCVRLTMVSAHAEFKLHLVDQNQVRLGLNNRQVGSSILLRRTPSEIGIEIDHTGEVKWNHEHQNGLISFEDLDDADYNDAVIRVDSVPCPPVNSNRPPTVSINSTGMSIPAVPAAPTVAPTPGISPGLSVTWNAIAATKEAPVDGYDLEYREKDATPEASWTKIGVNVSGTTATIGGPGLNYGKTYEVHIRSKNSEGESDWSPTGEGSIPSRLDVSFSSLTYSADEGNSATVTVHVSPTADRALSIPVSMSSVTAESGDYSPTGTTVSIVSGDNSGTFSISTTSDSDRDDETVSISFGNLPTAVGNTSPTTATLAITDTTPALVNVNPGNFVENIGGSTTRLPNSSFNAPYTPPANQAPTFNDGDSTERWVAEMSPEGTNIGHPVRATDADKDNLTFHIGGTDSASFSINSNTGQLKTKMDLDYEIKNIYSVRISVSDGEDGSDSIAVTIRVTDVVEVPVIDEDHQVVDLIDPDEETEITTVATNGTVTFPDDTRDELFIVRIDTNPDKCDWDSLEEAPAETLQACVTVEVFDTQGIPSRATTSSTQP